MKIVLDFGDFPEAALDAIKDWIEESIQEKIGIMRYVQKFEVEKKTDKKEAA